MKKGITIQLLAINSLKHPPVSYLAKQKIKSLCQAAVHLGLDAEQAKQIRKAAKEQFEKEFNKLPVNDVEAFHHAATKLLDATANRTFAALYKQSGSTLSFDEYAKKVKKIASEHRSSDASILVVDEDTKRFSLMK